METGPLRSFILSGRGNVHDDIDAFIGAVRGINLPVDEDGNIVDEDGNITDIVLNYTA